MEKDTISNQSWKSNYNLLQNKLTENNYIESKNRGKIVGTLRT